VEQHIKGRENAVIRTRLSCHSIKANAVRLQLHAMTTLRDRPVKIGARICPPRPFRGRTCADTAVIDRWRSNGGLSVVRVLQNVWISD
jgi:hypothetical protein